MHWMLGGRTHRDIGMACLRRPLGVAFVLAAALSACRGRDAGDTNDSLATAAAASTPGARVAAPGAGDSVTGRDSARAAPRDSARIAAGDVGEEDRPCLASRLGLPCAGADGHP